MRLIPKLEITSDSSLAQVPFAELSADQELLVRDLDAREAGAPQNVRLLHEIISQFSGDVIVDAGVRLVHVAELLLGLGAARVVVGVGEVATELALLNFGSRLGRAVIYSGFAEELAPFAGARSTLLLSRGSPEAAAALHPSELLVEPDAPFRNPESWADVRVSGLIVEIGQYSKRSWSG